MCSNRRVRHLRRRWGLDSNSRSVRGRARAVEVVSVQPFPRQLDWLDAQRVDVIGDVWNATGDAPDALALVRVRVRVEKET